ncbi:MAG: ABC transporter substrate-binding protein [Blautia caecimuris]
MKRKLMSILLCTVMTATTVAGATTVLAEEEKKDAGEKEWEYKEAELTLLIDPDTPTAGYQAVFDLCEEKTGIHIETEIRASGGDGDNQVKTRLASGEMTDLCVYNSGAKLGELNPEENFIDISGEEWADRLDDTFKAAVSAGSDTAVYGIPLTATYSGAILYNKELYEKYDLDVPHTWDDFIKNCETLKEAGETAVIGSLGDSWTIQVPYLGDYYNVLAEEPDFSKEFEEGTAKYATTPAALRSFEKLEDLQPYFNEDYTATTYADACDKLVNGEGAHWFILSQALSSIYELYGDEVNKIGLMGIPGDDPENHGLTVWEPTATIYGNANSEKKDDILRFMEFYISDEALDAFTEAQKPDGPYCIKGYELPEDAYDAVKQAQEYFDQGKTNVAMEYETSVKGTNCEYICSELATGQTTAEEAAQAYDDDCKKQATQLGLDWE